MSLWRIALACTLAIAALSTAAEEPWPLWDGQESVATKRPWFQIHLSTVD